MARRFFRPHIRPAPLAFFLAALSLAASGCSGGVLGIGTSESSCPAPQGGVCRSISEIHAGSSDPNPEPSPPSFRPMPAAAPGAEVVRTAPRVLQIWLAPHVDEDGDYVGEQRIHLVVDVGGWSVRPPSDAEGPPAESE